MTPTVYETASYVSPSVYFAPTSYLVPTTYYSGGGILQRLFGRRPVVETAAVVPTTYSYTYVPSTYILPTTYSLDLPVLATSSAVLSTTSSSPCDVTYATPPATPSTPAKESTPSEEPKFQPKKLESTPTHPSAPASPPAAPAPPAETPKAAGEGAGAAKAPTEPAFPALPEPEKDLVPPPAENVPSPPPPAAAGSNPPGGTASTATPEARREVMRPASYVRSRTTLNGKVVSAVSGKGEKGVVVKLVPNSSLYREKSVTTDADGQFQVVLTEGDWTVQVPKPGASTTIDRLITVSGGLITDEKEAPVTSLTINR